MIYIGTDPELFVKDNGKFISGYGLIPGTKEAPFPVEKGAVQVDGMALEFNIEPAADEDTFVSNIEHVFAQLRRMVKEEIVIEPVAHFGKEYMATQPPAALELGCDPDYNGWTQDINPSPDGNRDFRTAAGHVHIGYMEHDVNDFGAFLASCQLARQLDFYLGLPSLLFDKDTKRRELYGKAGAFRVKPYGMEYRTLSNAWLKEERLMRWVFSASRQAVVDLLAGRDLAEEEGDITDIINTSDVDSAVALIKKYNLGVPHAVEI